MTEKEILVSRALDKKQSAYDNSMITSTNFLSVDERAEIIPIERNLSSAVRTYYYGGYAEAERTVAVFVPTFIETDDIDVFFSENDYENPISLIKLKKDKFISLSHRDYLGSLMGLGIKREMLGDIIITNEGCFIFCLKSISKYICENLIKTGRGTVNCEICQISELPIAEDNSEKVFLSLASLRLDNVVSAAFNVSRALASDAINKGIVFVNSARIIKSDTPVKQGDKIVMRGKGKVVLSEIIGLNKKGRTHVTVKKYR